jgi:ribosomal-protein-alanine N-acetyltransferase
MSIATLTTDRLTLRPFTDQDVDALYRVLSDRAVHRYFPRTDPPSREQVKKIIAGQREHWETHGCGWWAVVLRANQALIGWCGLQFLPEFDETEVAFLLSPAHWGQGLGTEAARAAARFGFETLGLARLVAIAHIENVASQRVIAKLGMSLVEQRHLWGIECYRYAVQREDFAASRRRRGTRSPCELRGCRCAHDRSVQALNPRFFWPAQAGFAAVDANSLPRRPKNPRSPPALPEHFCHSPSH